MHVCYYRDYVLGMEIVWTMFATVIQGSLAWMISMIWGSLGKYPENFSGSDCVTNLLARKVLFSISNVTAGIATIFAIYRLITLLPVIWPFTMKQWAAMITILEFSCKFLSQMSTYLGYFAFSLFILAGDMWISFSGFTTFFLWMGNIGTIFIGFVKSFLFIQIALANQPITSSILVGPQPLYGSSLRNIFLLSAWLLGS